MAGYALPAEAEEQQVLRSCLDGRTDGLDLLYRRYAPALVAFCHHRLGNMGDAEDAAHETILKAHRALPRFREGARLWPWLATIAANVCTDIQRSRERLGPEQDAVEFAGPEVDEHVSMRLRASIVDAALDELPERFRTPLFLREFMGWSYEEIAAFSNKSIGSVRTTLMRARRAFQGRVEDVARRRGQWPLPAVVGGGGVTGLWRRMRTSVRSWREATMRAGGDAAAALVRAEGMFAAFVPGLQAAVVALAATGAFMVMPAGAAETVDQSPAAATSEGATVSGPNAAVPVQAGNETKQKSEVPADIARRENVTIAEVRPTTEHVVPDAPAGGEATLDADDDMLRLRQYGYVEFDNKQWEFVGDSELASCDPTSKEAVVCTAVRSIAGPSNQ